ncbi:hypothetical protein IQ260_22780 [Leptolyngbya cf. ectocarpi LEGE 11479]|uniref:Uncharacterized protein n=1 Tax=Leptolyngbya cf. ectocarpi LEGE 11479 TaxID=1828722 RepID=A0A928ZXV2_LEPEC|nr:hypothetical protein [Leptolyngbya ectocarpi]MBE9069476.1 hypothetical protein [Leptolyngbya cf. ectocarpi LEGE 11479]
MAFSDYKSIAQVQTEYQTKYKEANFIQPANYNPSQVFLEELKFNQENIDVFASEAARCETVIFPVLREVYKHYHQQTSLWVQKAIAYDNKLNGTPDYLISKRSALGKTMLEVPIIIVVEAKKNDFEQGWGQCLAELIAAAHINSEKIPVYGIVTDGKLWEFAQFMDNTLLKEQTSYTVSDLPVLLGVTNSIFEQATASLAVS